MKKLFFIIITFIGFNINLSHAQDIWFDAGIKASYGPTFLYNKNTVNSAEFDQKINTGFGVGGKFSFNFGYIHGITFDLMYSNGQQKYQNLSNTDLDQDVKWKSYDLYVLYRMYRTINYLELGPKFSKTIDFTNNDVDAKNYYAESFPSAVLGFGWYVFGRKTFTGTLGFRFEYGFNDLISDTGKEYGYPLPTATFDSYETTNRVSAQLVFELNWGIGYFAKTACGGRRHFFSFE